MSSRRLIAVLVIVLLVAVAGAIAFTGRAFVAAQLETEARTIAETIADAAETAIYRLDVRSLRERLRELRRNRDVSTAYITDAEGVILADGTVANIERDQKITGQFEGRVLLSRTWQSQVGDGLVRVGGPISDAAGDAAGYIVIGFESGGVFGLVGDNTWRGAVLVIACALAGVVALVLGGGAPASVPAAETGADQEKPVKAQRPASDRPRGASWGDNVDRLLACLHDPVLVSDDKGFVSAVNPASLGLLGYEREEVVGRPLGAVLETEVMIRERPVVGAEASYVAKSGDKTAVQLSTVIVRDSRGGLQDIVCVARPTTSVASTPGDADEGRASAPDSTVTEVRERLAAAEQQRDAAQGELGGLREELERARETIQRAAAKRSGPPGADAGKDELWAWAEEELKRVQERHQKTQEKLQGTEEALAKAADDRRAAEAERKRLETALEEATSQAKTPQEELVVLRASATETEEKLRKAERGRQLLEEQLRKAQEERGDVESQLQRAQQDRARVEAALQDAQAGGAAKQPATAVAATATSALSQTDPQQGAPKADPEVGDASTTVPEAAEPTADEPIMDRGEALAGVDGDMEFLKALIGVFLNDCPRQLSEIRIAVEQDDAGGVGARRANAQGRTGELRCPRGDHGLCTARTNGGAGQPCGCGRCLCRSRKRGRATQATAPRATGRGRQRLTSGLAVSPVAL